jgi:hypothetical protein
MDGHYHPLVWPSPRAQGCPGSQRSLGVNDAVVDFGEVSTQRIAKEHLMPMPMPDDAGGSAESRQNEAGAENGYRERPAPRERREKRGGHATTLEILPKLPDVCVNARDAFLSVHCGDHKRW